MISSEIIESDSFYSLSPTAQAIYLHLNINADDDGVVDNWQSVIRSMRARKEHLNALYENGLILYLSNGAVFIVHWGVNNKIRNDRYVPGRYKNDLTRLIVKGVAEKSQSQYEGKISK